MTPSELRAALKDQSLSQAAFARETGTTTQTVQRWVQGQRPIPGWVPVLLGYRATLRSAGILPTPRGDSCPDLSIPVQSVPGPFTGDTP